MSAYNPPITHNSSLNTVFNNGDFNYQTGIISLTTTDARYLKLTGGSVLGTTVLNNATVQNNFTVNNPITLPITYTASNSNQLGYVISSSVGSGIITAGNQNQTSIVLPYSGTYMITGNITFAVNTGGNYQASISDTSLTINTGKCETYNWNASGILMYFAVNLSLPYVSTTSNKTIYFVSGNNATAFNGVTNVCLTALRIA